MDNYYLRTEIARMQRNERLAQAEHERMLATNGPDLPSVVRRVVAERLGHLGRLRRPSVRVAAPARRLPASRFAPR
jgi:hypothetical protein